jgi:hypothetical protein
MSDSDKQQRVIVGIEQLMAESSGRISLAALGNRLAAKLGKSFREVIPDVTLVAFIEDHFSTTISVKGAPTSLIATLVPSLTGSQPTAEDRISSRDMKPYEGLTGPTRKYNAKFWAAFFTPARGNCRRAINPVIPFDWDDFPDRVPPEFIEIDPTLIPSKSEPWSDRKRIVGAAIEKWCRSNKFDPNDFRDQGLGYQSRIPVNQQGAQNLLSMVSAVNESERDRLSLSFAIIHALLHR